MAATTTTSGKVVTITYTNTDDDDWNYSTDAGLTSGMYVRAILWYPTSANDILIITEGSNSGPAIVHWNAVTQYKEIFVSFGSPGIHLKPYIDYGNCTFSGAATQKITFLMD